MNTIQMSERLYQLSNDAHSAYLSGNKDESNKLCAERDALEIEWRLACNKNHRTRKFYSLIFIVSIISVVVGYFFVNK